MGRLMLWGGVLVPVLYFATLIGTSLTWPEYSHVTQYASELGSAAAPRPELFNLGVMATGVAGVLAGLGFFVALCRLTGSTVLPSLAGLSLAAWGAAVVMAAVFPMPDDRHGGYGLGMAMQVAPLWVLLALRREQDAGRLRLLLLAVFIAMAVLFAIMMGVGGLVTRANVGLWQRSYALATMPWLALAALGVDRLAYRRG